jgi:superfamily I DNA/RNA helicase
MISKREDIGNRFNEIFNNLDLNERRAAVERMLNKLYEKRYAPEDIVLLRYESEMPDCLDGVSNLAGYDLNPYEEFDVKNPSIRCTTVRKYKGMESRVTILYDIYSKDVLSAPLMYVGSTRAKNSLGLVYSNLVEDQLIFIKE